MKTKKDMFITNKKIFNSSSVNKSGVLIIVTLFIMNSVSALNLDSQGTMPFTSNTSRNTTWNVSLDFDETSGKNDYIVFGEAPDASDGVDSYDAPNPPSGPEPFLDAYFTTNFPWPYNKLFWETREYPDTYKVWNFTVWWTGSDTTVTISWDTTKVNDSEYDTVVLCDGFGVPFVNMLNNDNYTFFCPGDGMVHFQIITMANTPPILFNEYPANESTNIERPPNELKITVEDPNGDTIDVFIRWKNHTGDWITLQSYTGVVNGTYSFVPPEENDWIWGNTTYIWSVNANDPSGSAGWTNETYQYNTGGSRYDVNNNNRVNFQDAGLVWIHRTSEVGYDGIYDVDQNGEVNFQDAGLAWVNRD